MDLSSSEKKHNNFILKINEDLFQVGHVTAKDGGDHRLTNLQTTLLSFCLNEKIMKIMLGFSFKTMHFCTTDAFLE